MNTSSERRGVMIVRLWIEENHTQGLRARITQTLDTMTGEEAVAVASSADDICAVVKRWVEDFAKPGSPAGNGRRDPPSTGDEAVTRAGHDDTTNRTGEE